VSAWRVAVILVSVMLAASVALSEIEGALVVLEAAPGTPGSEPWGAPPRFVLMKDGQVFVGGASHLETGRLEKGELQALRKRIDAARKSVDRGGRPSPNGEDAATIRLRFPEDGPTETALDPATASAAPQALVALVAELLRYDHPSLVRYAAASYALAARERPLIGGCRPWTFAFPIERALAAAVTVPAADAIGWPTGAMPASVCVGDRRFVVTLRPLLPGEQP
jgi:hypothetical protein